jgi:hypothetical protein
MANDPYPVFKSGTVEQQRSSGGGGSVATITKGVLVGLAAILAIGFSVVAISNCREDAEHAAAKAARRQDREGLKACETDPLGSQCTSYKARHQDDTTHAECESGAREREKWIQGSTDELGGYAPATFHMSAGGPCSTVLRVHEDDCSIPHLVEAYGNKPFMLRARSLGFARFSCGWHDYAIAEVIGR